MVKVYLECRDHKTYPSAGPYSDQTAFTIDLFEYLDELFAAAKEKVQKSAHVSEQKPGKKR